MWTQNFSLTVLILVVDFFKPTNAIECGNGSTTLTLSSQADIDNRLAGCPTWMGHIQIRFDWNGSFVLNNVTNITGSFLTDREVYQRQSPFLTSIVAGDLKSVGNLSFNDAPLLSEISLPKLERAWNFRVFLDSDLEPNTAVTLEAPSLASASAVELGGSFPFVHFPSLVEVLGGLWIANKRYWYGGIRRSEPAITPYSLAIDMPVLVNAHLIQIWGNVSKISMPLLANMSFYPYRGWMTNELDIAINGQPLAISFPSLWNVTDISLAGPLTSVSFPALENMDGWLRLNASINMTYNSRPLHRASGVQLDGNVTEYDISSLTYVDSLVINTNSPVDCEPARAFWQGLHSGGYNYSQTYRCRNPIRSSVDDHEEKKKKPFPKVAVGLSCGIGIPVWIFFMFALWHSRKEKRKAEEVAKIPPPDYDAEMAARSAGGGEILPVYEPRRSQGSGGSPGSVIELVDMTRPSAHPPHPLGYEAATAGASSAVPATTSSGDAQSVRVVAADDQPRPAGAT